MFNSTAARATSRIDFAHSARRRHFPTRPAAPAIVPGLFGSTSIRTLPYSVPAPVVTAPLTALAARLAS